MSSAGYIGKTTNKWGEVAGRETTADREDLFSGIPAKTVGPVSADGRTVSVQPLFKRRLPDGTFLDYPELPKVPINYTTTANGGMTFPIPEGTRVELVSASRSMDILINSCLHGHRELPVILSGIRHRRLYGIVRRHPGKIVVKTL